MLNQTESNLELQNTLQHAVDQKTKPPGSLGELEALAIQIGLIQNSKSPSVDHPKAFVFGADHGVCEEGVNPFPQAVTEQMLANFASGGAAMSVFCRTNNIPLDIINMGIINNEATWPNVRNHAVSTGTRNLLKTSAMTLEQCDAALKTGHTLAKEACEQGHNLLIIGEMGIGNTTSASAILAALTGADAKHVVGPGTGANAEQQALKAKVISAALARFNARDAKAILCEVGGFEIAAMVGVLVAAKSLNVAVMVDGFIATAAAMIANGIAPESRSHWIFEHESAEPAHQLMLKALEAKPLLQLGLRLGEGTGSALAYPIVKCAVAMLNEMATFADAGISES